MHTPRTGRERAVGGGHCQPEESSHQPPTLLAPGAPTDRQPPGPELNACCWSLPTPTPSGILLPQPS